MPAFSISIVSWEPHHVQLPQSPTPKINRSPCCFTVGYHLGMSVMVCAEGFGYITIVALGYFCFRICAITLRKLSAPNLPLSTSTIFLPARVGTRGLIPIVGGGGISPRGFITSSVTWAAAVPASNILEQASAAPRSQCVRVFITLLSPLKRSRAKCYSELRLTIDSRWCNVNLIAHPRRLRGASLVIPTRPVRWLSQCLRVAQRPLSAGSPEVGKDDHACDCSVRTPQRGKRIALDLHYNQQNRQVCRPEQYHGLDLREKQRTARRDHVQHRDRRVVRRLIDVHNAVSPDAELE